MPNDIEALKARLRDRAKRMNGALVGASDGGTYALGYYDQFAAADDKEAAKTMLDGTRVALSQDEAAAIWREIEEAGEKRAKEMPTARDALRVMIAAKQRLQELGWWEGGGLRIEPGDECAVTQTGSTGMWRGRLDAKREYVLYGDCVSKPQDCWLKPLADLTDDERAWMDECDRREAEAYSAMLDRYAAARPLAESDE